MALDTYTSANREVEVPLSLEYEREIAVTKSVRQPYATTQYRYTRRAKKTYRYKGLSETAAKSCLVAMRAKYVRRIMNWAYYELLYRTPSQLVAKGLNWLAQPDTYEQVATFNVKRNSVAPVFDVQITVNELLAIYDTHDWNPNTAEGQAAIEARFREKSGTVCLYSYLPTFDYDES